MPAHGFSISIVIILLRITETFIYTMEGQYEPFTRTEGELLPSKKESLLQPQKGRLSKIIPTSLVGDGMIFVIGAFFVKSDSIICEYHSFSLSLHAVSE